MKVPRTNARRARKTFRRIPKVATKVKNTMDNIIDATEKAEQFREVLADKPIGQIASMAGKLAAMKKNPIGVVGLSLMPTEAREASVSGAATGDVTTSATLYMYRPPRKRSREGAINYAQKTNISWQQQTVNDQQVVSDINILDAVPVLNNPDTNLKYSNLSIKKAFDNYLATRTKSYDGTNVDLLTQQASLHFKSLQADLMIFNNDTHPVFVDLYEVVPQHDLGPTTYSTEYTATGYMSPKWTWAQGLGTDTIKLEDSIGASTIGSNPFDSTTFSRTWKIVKRLRLNIPAGATHRHKSVYEINKTVSYQQYAQVSTSGGKFAGWNPSYMLCQRGGPDGSQMALASNISITSTMQLNYEAYPDTQAKVIVYDSNT